MAEHYTTIPAPGSPGGPCRGSCSHPWCIAARQLADDRCAHCGIRLGFGTKITGEVAVHLRCAQQEAARHHEPAADAAHQPTHSHQSTHEPNRGNTR
jgi:hypothetical protein